MRYRIAYDEPGRLRVRFGPDAFTQEQGYGIAALLLGRPGVREAVTCALNGSVLVCYGDMPLMRRATYESLIETHKREGNDCTLLSAVSDEELPYGRIVRKSDGSFSHIVEDKDCTPEEKAIREKAFAGYQINRELMAETNPGCMVQHCLPAHRGEEITADVFEEHAEEIFDEAENRMHTIKAVMYELMK